MVVVEMIVVHVGINSYILCCDENSTIESIYTSQHGIIDHSQLHNCCVYKFCTQARFLSVQET